MRIFERYYNTDIRKRIYKWCPKNIVEWYKNDDEILFDILDDLCCKIYNIGYSDGYDDGEY